jgi:hypothetical protein
MTNASYRKLTLGLLGAWLSYSVAASALSIYRNDSALVALPILAAAAGPIALFVLWYTLSPGLRRFAASLSPRTLTLAQTWRINGFVFILLSALGALPALFALPAGLGDMAVGATAPWIASRLGRGDRGGYLLWQILGISDLLMAVTLGATARLISPAGTSMSAMTVLPLSLVPTFFVPLLFILHLISIAQALHWPAERYFPVDVARASGLQHRP